MSNLLCHSCKLELSLSDYCLLVDGFNRLFISCLACSNKPYPLSHVVSSKETHKRED